MTHRGQTHLPPHLLAWPPADAVGSPVPKGEGPSAFKARAVGCLVGAAPEAERLDVMPEPAAAVSAIVVGSVVTSLLPLPATVESPAALPLPPNETSDGAAPMDSLPPKVSTAGPGLTQSVHPVASFCQNGYVRNWSLILYASGKRTVLVGLDDPEDATLA